MPEALTQKEVSVETLDDMSLSSSASMDTNHTSQEYMDDFDNLGERQTHTPQICVPQAGFLILSLTGSPRWSGAWPKNRVSLGNH